MKFTNKVVIVTGASSGIGAATAILFAKEGANVTVVGRNEVKLKKTVEECTKFGNSPLVIKADVTRETDVRRIVEETIEKFGKIDVLVNNAGMSTSGCLLDGNLLNSFDEVVNVNLRAVINITSLAVPYLIKSKGNIVNISSVVAKLVPIFPGMTAYSISKAGLDKFTECSALELASSGVRVNSINPGPVATDFNDNAGIETENEKLAKLMPLKRVSDPEEIADMVLFLASDKAKGITGSTFVSDNGFLLSR